MQMREWRRWRRLLALTAVGLSMLAPAAARGDGSGETPRATERVEKIGPQAVVIVNEQGSVRMYDDPSQKDRACKSRGSCWGKALNALSVFGILTYEDLTEGVEGGGRVAGPGRPVE